MCLLAVSDSHGHTDRLTAIAKNIKADAIVHLGDNVRDAEVLAPYAKVYAVQGNCDFAAAESEQLLQLEGKRVLITHGHRYHVKSGLDELMFAAEQQKAQLVLYGHTHIAGYEFHGRTLFLNPGAVMGCRDTGKCTYAVLEWKPGGEIYMQMAELDR